MTHQHSRPATAPVAVPMTRWQGGLERFLAWLGGDPRRNCECCGVVATARGSFARTAAPGADVPARGYMGFLCADCGHVSFDDPPAAARGGGVCLTLEAVH